MEEVLESSAEHVIATLRGVHPESTQYFLGAAERLTEELGSHALASALAHLSGFSQPPSSRSLISHEQVKSDRRKRCIFLTVRLYLPLKSASSADK